MIGRIELLSFSFRPLLSILPCILTYNFPDSNDNSNIATEENFVSLLNCKVFSFSQNCFF